MAPTHPLPYSISCQIQIWHTDFMPKQTALYANVFKEAWESIFHYPSVNSPMPMGLLGLSVIILYVAGISWRRERSMLKFCIPSGSHCLLLPLTHLLPSPWSTQECPLSTHKRPSPCTRTGGDSPGSWWACDDACLLWQRPR